MKKLMLILSCTLLLMAAGCKKHRTEEPDAPQSLAGEVARPSWNMSDDYDFSSSMTAILKVDLSLSYPDAVDENGQIVNSQIVNDNDLLAAFISDECVGIASPEDGLFYLYITILTSNSDNGQTSNSTAISLRYYSASLKNLFEAADVLEFQNDARIGTVSDPFAPKFIVVDK